MTDRMKCERTHLCVLHEGHSGECHGYALRPLSLDEEIATLRERAKRAEEMLANERAVVVAAVQRAEKAEAEVERLKSLCPHAQDGACLDWQRRAELVQARYEQEKILHDRAQAEANERHAKVKALEAELLSAREALAEATRGPRHGEGCPCHVCAALSGEGR